MRSWWPHSLRAQLTAWQVCAMVVVLGLYVGLVLWLVTRNLSGTIDSRLRTEKLIGQTSLRNPHHMRWTRNSGCGSKFEQE